MVDAIATGSTPAERLLMRFNDCMGRRNTFNQFYQEISEVVYPTKSNITIRQMPGEEQHIRVFDSTAINARRRLASSLQSSLTSSSIVWYELVTIDSDLMEFDDVKRWLTSTRDRMFMAMQHSNMDSQLNEAYNDLVTFGSMLTMEDESEITRRGFNGLNFRTFPVQSYAWEEDRNGLVNAVYRVELMNARKAMLTFGEENLPPKMREALANPKKDKDFEVVHMVYPRADTSLPFPPAIEMPWASVFISKDDSAIIRESGFRRFPYIAARWNRTSHEVYGRSPAMEAMPDIRTLNRIVEMELMAMNRATNPPMLTDDDGSLGGNMIVRPGGMLFIRKDSRLEYLESRTQFQAVNLKKLELQDSVNKGFLIDQLMLPPPQGTPMTATEIDKRVEQMIRLLGPELSGLNVELLRPLLSNTFHIMWFAGAFEVPPDRVLERMQGRTGPMITVQLKGPIARSQKISDVIAAERWIAEVIGPAAQIDPKVVDMVDTDAYARIGAERLGVPMEFIRTPAAVDIIRLEKQQQEQELLQQEMANRQLEAAGRSAPIIKELEAQGGGSITAAA